MTTQFTHRSRLVVGAVLVTTAVTVVAGLLWGTWRLLSWGVVTATHHRYGYATGAQSVSSMGGYALGVDVVVTRGDVLIAGVSLFAVTLALIAVLLVFLIAMVRVGDYADDPVTALEPASVRREIDDEEFAHRKRILTGEVSGAEPHTPSRQ